MAEERVPSPDSILSEAESNNGQPAVEDFSRKKNRAAPSMRKRLRDFLNGEEPSSDEERLGAKGRYQERESIRALRKKIRHLEAKMDALERRNDRLEDLLVNRLSRFREVSRPGTSADKTTGDTDPNENATPDFPEVDGQVDIGEGVHIPAEDWRKLLGQDRDSLFCKHAVKLLWSRSELKERSVTGKPSRNIHISQASLKALSPVKLRAVENAFKVFVGKMPNEVPTRQRLKRMNYYIAEMLNDLRRMK